MREGEGHVLGYGGRGARRCYAGRVARVHGADGEARGCEDGGWEGCVWVEGWVGSGAASGAGGRGLGVRGCVGELEVEGAVGSYEGGLGLELGGGVGVRLIGLGEGDDSIVSIGVGVEVGPGGEIAVEGAKGLGEGSVVGHGVWGCEFCIPRG